MGMISKYILSIVCASVIVSIAVTFASKNQVIGSVIKLLSGLFLAITLVSPWINVNIVDFTAWFDSVQADADLLIDDAEEMYDGAMEEIIINKTASYILDKAATLKIYPSVEVILSQEAPYVPKEVILSGEASPYAKQQLQKIIEDDLDIAKENQTWK